MSLVCVDELEQLENIERLVKHEITRAALDEFNPKLSIKSEPTINEALITASWSIESPIPNMLQTTITHVIPTVQIVGRADDTQEIEETTPCRQSEWIITPTM